MTTRGVPDAQERARAAGLDLLDGLAAAASILATILLEPPDDALLARLAAVDLPREWPLPPASDVAVLRSALEAVSTLTHANTAELVADHMALFDAPGHSLANPYESVRCDPEHLMYGARTLAVRSLYARHGLAVPRPTQVADDHLGLELGFVSHLALRALDAAEAEDLDAHDVALGTLAMFAEEHVLQIADDVAADVLTHASTDYYRGWAVLIQDFAAHLRGLAG